MNISTSRRATLRGAAVAAAAGFLGTAATASAIPPTDSAIIGLCRELIQARREVDALLAHRTTVAIEQETDADLIALYDRISAIEDKLEALGTPTSLPGAIALTRAALASVHRKADGQILVENGWAEGAGWTVLEYLADQHGGGSMVAASN